MSDTISASGRSISSQPQSYSFLLSRLLINLPAFEPLRVLGALRGPVLPGPEGISLEKELSQPDTYTLAAKLDRGAP